MVVLVVVSVVFVVFVGVGISSDESSELSEFEEELESNLLIKIRRLLQQSNNTTNLILIQIK